MGCGRAQGDAKVRCCGPRRAGVHPSGAGTGLSAVAPDGRTTDVSEGATVPWDHAGDRSPHPRPARAGGRDGRRPRPGHAPDVLRSERGPARERIQGGRLGPPPPCSPAALSSSSVGPRRATPSRPMNGARASASRAATSSCARPRGRDRASGRRGRRHRRSLAPRDYG